MELNISNIFTVFFISILAYQCILSFIQYRINYKKEFLFYGLFILALFINFVVNFYYWLNPLKTDIAKQLFGLPINFFIQVIYFLFLIEYLQLKSHKTILQKNIQSLFFINFILGIITTILALVISKWPFWLNAAIIIINVTLFFYTVYLLVKNKVQFSNFIIKGSAWLGVSFFINLLFAIFQFNFFNNDIIIMAGVLTEILYFNYALQNKMSTQEKQLLLAEINKQKAIDEEHRRVSADLHDELGSTLSSIQIMSVVSNKKIETDLPESKRLLQIISSQSQKMQHNLSDIVWGLRTDLDSVEDLTIKMNEILATTLGTAGIHYQIEVGADVNEIKLSVMQRRNILLIFKEAINNILKYAQAQKVTIHIFVKPPNLNLTITDDGIGFNQLELNNTSNGLTNMKLRAEQINGAVKINSVIGNGTIIFCSILI